MGNGKKPSAGVARALSNLPATQKACPPATSSPTVPAAQVQPVLPGIPRGFLRRAWHGFRALDKSFHAWLLFRFPDAAKVLMSLVGALDGIISNPLFTVVFTLVTILVGYTTPHFGILLVCGLIWITVFYWFTRNRRIRDLTVLTRVGTLVVIGTVLFGMVRGAAEWTIRQHAEVENADHPLEVVPPMAFQNNGTGPALVVNVVNHTGKIIPTRLVSAAAIVPTPKGQSERREVEDRLWSDIEDSYIKTGIDQDVPNRGKAVPLNLRIAFEKHITANDLAALSSGSLTMYFLATVKSRETGTVLLNVCAYRDRDRTERLCDQHNYP